MIYLDSSIVLAQLFSEDRCPADLFWTQSFVSSRLLEYEVWNRVNARNLAGSQGEATRELIGRVALVDLDQPMLSRALEPFPVAARTLDALHLATMDFLRSQGQSLELASYDLRLAAAAEAIGFPLAEV